MVGWFGSDNDIYAIGAPVTATWSSTRNSKPKRNSKQLPIPFGLLVKVADDKSQLSMSASKKAVYLPRGLERGCHRNGDYIESFCISFHSFNTAYTTSTQQHNFNHTSTHTNSSMDRKREYVQRDTWYDPIQRTRTRSLHTKGTALKS